MKRRSPRRKTRPVDTSAKKTHCAFFEWLKEAAKPEPKVDYNQGDIIKPGEHSRKAYYVYELFASDDLTPFYVGQSNAPNVRLASHMNSYYATNPEEPLSSFHKEGGKLAVMRAILDRGAEVWMRILKKYSTVEEALAAETQEQQARGQV